MITVNDVLTFLSEKFPLNTACDFDNVGLLIGDESDEVKKVLTCLDCDVFAVKKASEIGANLIVTHHPVIFDGIKTLLSNSVPFLLVKNGISVISMHTNFDVGVCGVNDILCEKIGLKNVKKYLASDGFLINEATCDETLPDLFAKRLNDSLGIAPRYVSGRPIEKVLVCSGSGGGFIEDTIKGNFDALITADVKHNQFVSAINSGVSLFDCGHYNTEVICVEPLKNLICSKFSDLLVETYYCDKIKSF